MRLIAQLTALTAGCLLLASLAATDNGVAAQAHPYHFTVTQGDTSTLYLAYAEDGLPVRVAEYDRLLGVAWAPETLTAAVAAMQGTDVMLHQVNMLNGERSQVSAGKLAARLRDLESIVSWSADGEYVVLRLDFAVFTGAEIAYSTRLAVANPQGLVWSSQRAAYEPTTTVRWVGASNQLYDVHYTSPVAGVEQQVDLQHPLPIQLGPCRANCGLRAWSADGNIAYRYDHTSAQLIRDDILHDTATTLELDAVFDMPETLVAPQVSALHTDHAGPYTFLEVEARTRFFTSEYGPRAPLTVFDVLYRVDERTGTAETFSPPFPSAQMMQVDATHGLILLRDGAEQADIRLTNFERTWTLQLPWDATAFWVTERHGPTGPEVIVRGASDAYRVWVGADTIATIDLPRGSVISNDGTWYIQDRRGTPAGQTAAFRVAAVAGSQYQNLNLAGMSVPRWHDTIPFPPRPDWPRTLGAVVLGVLAVGVLWRWQR